MEIRIIENTLGKPIHGLSFAPDGTKLVAGGNRGYDIWDLNQSSKLHIPSHPVSWLFGCVYDPLGHWAYVSDFRVGFRLLALDGGESGLVPGSEYNQHVRSFSVGRNGRQLAMSRGGGGACRIEYWQVEPSGRFRPAWSRLDGQPVSCDEPYITNQAQGTINEVAVLLDGTLVAAEDYKSDATGDKPMLVLRDASDGSLLQEIGRSKTGFESKLHPSSGGRQLYVWDGDMIELWDVQAGTLIGHTETPGQSKLTGLRSTPHNELFVTASGDGKVRYWDPSTLAVVKEEKLGIGKLLSLDTTEEGRAGAGGNKGQIALWQIS